jgi:hypothetical protein
VTTPPAAPYDPSQLATIPTSFQDITDHFDKAGEVPLFLLRAETLRRIETATSRPLICYVAKTHNIAPTVPAHIDDGDLLGFGDLVRTTPGTSVDILLISNGGSVEATERIVRLLRNQYGHIRFVVPANAYSAATLMCFSGDEILLDPLGTLGPIDPQINGVPARAILRAMESLEERLRDQGPRSLTAYIPMLQKLDLHVLEICKSAQALSKELAVRYLSQFMLRAPDDDPRVAAIVDHFSDYDLHKSHGRSIDREKCQALGLLVGPLEADAHLRDLVRSLVNQYELFFDKSPFFKLYENARGINWGRQSHQVTIPVPTQPPIPQGPPARTR